jgi:hypothetical protein
MSKIDVPDEALKRCAAHMQNFIYDKTWEKLDDCVKQFRMKQCDIVIQEYEAWKKEQSHD